MKKTLALILAILMLLSMAACGAPEQAPSQPTELSKYDLYLDIEFEMNFLFSTYDVELYLDDARVGLAPHGQHYTCLLEHITEGSHKLYFYKDGDHSIRNYKELKLKEDSTFVATLHSNKSDIEIKGASLNPGIAGSSLKMPNVTGMVLEEAINTLKQVGFSNVHYGDDVWDRNNWIVTEQSVKADEETDKNTRIDLTCEKKDGSQTSSSTGSAKFDARKADPSGIYSYKQSSKYADFYLYIDTNNDTIRSFSSDSTTVLVGTLSGSLENGLKACYEKNVWYEDMFLKENDFYSLYAIDNMDNAVVRYSRVENFEAEEYLKKAGYKDYYEESGTAKKVTDCQVDDAIINAVISDVKNEFGDKLLSYSYDIVSNEYRLYFKEGLMSTYNANLSKYRELFDTVAGKYNTLTKEIYERLNKNTKNEVHVSAYLYSVGMASGNMDECQYRARDGKKTDIYN